MGIPRPPRGWRRGRGRLVAAPAAGYFPIPDMLLLLCLPFVLGMLRDEVRVLVVPIAGMLLDELRVLVVPCIAGLL